jgi:multiple sugar transport system ATP-binding protein
MSRSGLKLSGITKRFATTTVIRDVELEVQPGELVVFVGPSGCGKSTLLRLIAGLETPTAGSISIGDRDVTAVEPAKRGIAMVFQSYALYPHMSVAQNMGFGLRIQGLPRAEVRARVARAAQTLQLEAFLDRKPRELSGGQRQRVAIGRAIVREPEVFLFDEPLSNLDAALRGQMRAEIARLHQQLHATMIYVTHDQVEAMTLATRIVVLNGGRVEQVGAPLELYHRPANLFVAGFIGAPRMNFLRGRLLAGLEHATLDIGGARFRAHGLTRSADDDTFTLGVRPEDFALAGQGEGHFRGTVRLVERLGSESLVHVEIEGPPAATVVARIAGDAPVAVGGPALLAANLSRSHFFDVLGRRLEVALQPVSGDTTASVVLASA